MLENLIKRIKKTYKSKILPYLAIPIFALPFVASCDKLHKKGDYAPVFITQSLPDAREAHNYSTKLSAYDKNKDIAKYEKVSGAPWLTVFSDGLMQGTPQDNDTGINSLELKVTDKKGLSDQKTFDLNVQNISTLSGKVYNIETEAPISQANVQIGNTSITTLADGSFQLDNVSDGMHDTTISATGFTTHYAGKWLVSHQKELDNKMDVDFKLINDDSIFNKFFNETCRDPPGAQTRYLTRWSSDLKPKFYLDIRQAPNQIAIDNAISIIENEFPELTLGFINNTVANGGIIVDNGSVVPVPASGTPGWIIYEWEINSNDHYEYLNGNNIYSASARVKPTADIGIQREEYAQNLGFSWDSDVITDTLFNESPPHTWTTYSPADRKSFKIMYSRPISNTNPDNNPSDHIINP